MKNGYLDKNLVQNSTLSCILLTYFIKEYEKLTVNTESPDILKVLLVLPIVWHKESCQLVSSKNKKTGIRKALIDYPLLLSNFEKRINDFSPITIQGLNIGYATGLLSRKVIQDELLISCLFDRWPSGFSPTSAPSEMIYAIDRLAFWFKNHSTSELYSTLLEG